MKNVKADFAEIRLFADNLKKLGARKNVDAFMENEIKVLGAGLQATCIEHTPTGEYDKEVEFIAYKGTDREKKVKFSPSTGKTGGSLKRNWKVGNAQKIANGQKIEIFNDLFYAAYVNYGHRIMRNGVQIGMYEGIKFMEEAADEFADSNVKENMISKDLEKYITEGMNGKN